MSVPNFLVLDSVEYILPGPQPAAVKLNGTTYPLGDSGTMAERFAVAADKFVPNIYRAVYFVVQLPRPRTDVFTSGSYATIYQRVSQEIKPLKGQAHLLVFVPNVTPDTLRFIGDMTRLATQAAGRMPFWAKVFVHGHSWMSQLYLGDVFVPIVSLLPMFTGWLGDSSTVSPIDVVTCTDWVDPLGISRFRGHGETVDAAVKTMVTEKHGYDVITTVFCGVNIVSSAPIRVLGDRRMKLATNATRDGHPLSRGSQVVVECLVECIKDWNY
ncbi:P11 [Sclerotinia sclerotiorum mycoreovirus 4]|uniref:P11 n=1 Tax=Sclerotinia sclerotiorum mycoreovirus 4 TaxID=1840528 RepID=UPI0007C1F696|nr:P11 [Sclerotinia sclerotiorum mycoreovirus 4]ANC52169.1 P11 [Sclerotinia sclerotiorum mycoreovirus 4]